MTVAHAVGARDNPYHILAGDFDGNTRLETLCGIPKADLLANGRRVLGRIGREAHICSVCERLANERGLIPVPRVDVPSG